MKIIDTHTHFPGFALGSAPRPIEQLRSEFEQEGLCGAWIMTTDGLLRNPGKHNDILAEALKDHRDFFVHFCTVDPHEGTGKALEELVRSKDELGARGIKLHPWLQAFSLTHPAILPIMRKAGELQMPVLFHDGTPPYSTPLQIAAVAEKVPETTVVLGHSGLGDLFRDAMCACLRHPNIHLCCCSVSSGHLSQIIAECPTEKLLFGSDGGFLRGIVPGAIDKFTAACKDESVLEKIFYENPKKLVLT